MNPDSFLIWAIPGLFLDLLLQSFLQTQIQQTYWRSIGPVRVLLTSLPRLIQQSEGVQGRFATLWLGYLQAGEITMAPIADNAMSRWCSVNFIEVGFQTKTLIFFQNTFSKLASSDKLQGSIERLAEKWEAKRKNISDDLNPEDLEFGGSDSRTPRSSSTSEQNKLIALKQQTIPKRRSLLKPPAGPR